MQLFEEFEKTRALIDECKELVSKIETKNMFIMLFGTMADVWAAMHHLTAEESKNLMRELCEMHAKVNDELGVLK